MTPDRLPRRTRWLIGLSVALNLFFLAFFAAQSWRVVHGGPLAMIARPGLGSGGVAETILQRIAGQLPPDDARVFRQAMQSRLPEVLRLQRQSLAAMEQVRADVAARPFDAEKTRADMQAARQLRQQIAPLVEAALLEALPRMSDAGRRALGEIRLLPRQ